MSPEGHAAAESYGRANRVRLRPAAARSRSRCVRPRRAGEHGVHAVCYAEAAANLLTNPALDPFGKIPEFKFCAVRAERAGISAAAE